MQEVKLSFFKAVLSIIGTLIAGAIIGIFGIVRVSDTTTVLVRANASDINELKEHVVPRGEWEATTQSLLDNDREMLEAIRDLDDKLDSVLLSR